VLLAGLRGNIKNKIGNVLEARLTGSVKIKSLEFFIVNIIIFFIAILQVHQAYSWEIASLA